MINDQQKYGTLIARLIAKRITVEEEHELEEWICRDDGNMQLFEDLTDEMKSDWAREWFAAAGVDTTFIKWKKNTGWYSPEAKRLKGFYLLFFAMLLFMALVYIVNKYL